MEKQIDREMLDGLGIYELRELAREIGVSSPTTKKRAVLFDEILQISSGQKKIEAKTNKGRPPKTITKITNIISDYIPEEILSLQKPVEKESFGTILKLAQNPLFQNSFEEKTQIYGYLDSINGHYYLNNLKNYDIFKSMTFYVPGNIVTKYSLREGDKIFAKGKMSEKHYCGLIDEIIKINDKNISQFGIERKKLDIVDFVIPSKNTTSFGKEIKMGERTISFFDSTETAMLVIANEIESLNSNEKLVFLGLELAPEILYYGKAKPELEMFATTYYNTIKESYNAVINSINYCSTMLKDGNNVRFYIFDIIGILNRLDQYFSSENGEYLGHKSSSVQIIKKLIGSGKAISNELALTSNAIALKSEKDEQIIKNELTKIAKIVEI